MRLDSHQHFWRYHPTHQVWMTEAMKVLKRDYLPDELKPLLAAIQFDGTIVVQARQMPEETEWLLALSDQYEFIKGVVGWVDLQSAAVHKQLIAFAEHPKFVGVRHVVHDEPDDNFMLRPEFQRGLAHLREFDLAFDLLLYPRHLPVAVKLVEDFPCQSFVLNHIGKPSIRDGLILPWEEDINQLARFPNVFCKLSGMVTEAEWKKWQPDDFVHYLDIVVAAFGTERVMIGSDWPVCTLSHDYSATMNLVVDYVRQFPERIQNQILGGNCARFYAISPYSQ